MGAIYKIEHVATKRFYIGSAINFKARRRQHLYDLRRGNHHSRYLQRVFHKYGESSLSFSIIEDEVEADKLLAREQYYLDYLNPVFNGCSTAGSRLGSVVTDSAKAKQRAKMSGAKIHTTESRAAISKSLLGNKRCQGHSNAQKVTPKILAQVSELRKAGLGCRRIAVIVNLSKSTILNIFNNKTNYG